MSFNFNVKLAQEAEKIRVVLNHLDKKLDNPLKMKSTYPELWESLLDVYIILDDQ